MADTAASAVIIALGLDRRNTCERLSPEPRANACCPPAGLRGQSFIACHRPRMLAAIRAPTSGGDTLGLAQVDKASTGTGTTLIR
jgi:hypothetical protein